MCLTIIQGTIFRITVSDHLAEALSAIWQVTDKQPKRFLAGAPQTATKLLLTWH
jgi:hypothetical protein